MSNIKSSTIGRLYKPVLQCKELAKHRREVKFMLANPIKKSSTVYDLHSRRESCDFDAEKPEWEVSLAHMGMLPSVLSILPHLLSLVFSFCKIRSQIVRIVCRIKGSNLWKI